MESRPARREAQNGGLSGIGIQYTGTWLVGDLKREKMDFQNAKLPVQGWADSAHTTRTLLPAATSCFQRCFGKAKQLVDKWLNWLQFLLTE